MQRIKQLLVADARNALKWYSVHVTVALTVLSVLYDYVGVIHDALPGGWVKYGLLLIIIARMLRQNVRPNADSTSN